jgi:hypothetical protein
LISSWSHKKLNNHNHNFLPKGETAGLFAVDLFLSSNQRTKRRVRRWGKNRSNKEVKEEII